MAFINNKKLAEIRNAAQNGNEKAKMIIQAMRKFEPQQNIDTLIDSYYEIDNFEPPADEELVQPESINPEPERVPEQIDVADRAEVDGEVQIEENVQPMEEQPSEDIPQELLPEETQNVENQVEVQDLTEVLDGETEGLFDENEIEDTSFVDFLGNKKRDGLRAKKNADYFKAYDLEGRTNYMNNKIDAYKSKFDDRLKDIDRRYNDIGLSLDSYSNKANEMLDDDIELDMDKANSAYSDFVGNDRIMHSFGRHWDENDTNEVVNALHELMAQYGKKNVIAALNTLKSDNESYKGYLDNQIDTEISRYSKNIENLLK